MKTAKSDLDYTDTRAHTHTHTNMHPCTHTHAHTAHMHTNMVHSLVNDTDLKAFIFTDFGKKFMKSVNLSPDGFLHLAIQLAYYK